MSEWKKICCAIDFSEPSRFAMEEAASLARQLKADLALLHVYEAPLPMTADMVLSPPELFERAVKEMERKMDGWQKEAERIAGRPVQSTVLAGDAAAVILRFLRQGLFDLLVTGTHGRTGLRHLVLGSVAEKVVRQAACPVLVIRGSGTVETD